MDEMGNNDEKGLILIQKNLGLSDVNSGALRISKGDAQKYFGNQDKEIHCHKEDSEKIQNFSYRRRRKNSRFDEYVLTRGWTEYVKVNKLKQGDIVLFKRHRSIKDHFVISYKRAETGDGAVPQPGNDAAGRSGYPVGAAAMTTSSELIAPNESSLSPANHQDGINQISPGPVMQMQPTGTGNDQLLQSASESVPAGAEAVPDLSVLCFPVQHPGFPDAFVNNNRLQEDYSTHSPNPFTDLEQYLAMDDPDSNSQISLGNDQLPQPASGSVLAGAAAVTTSSSLISSVQPPVSTVPFGDVNSGFEENSAPSPNDLFNQISSGMITGLAKTTSGELVCPSPAGNQVPLLHSNPQDGLNQISAGIITGSVMTTSSELVHLTPAPNQSPSLLCQISSGPTMTTFSEPVCQTPAPNQSPLCHENGQDGLKQILAGFARNDGTANPEANKILRIINVLLEDENQILPEMPVDPMDVSLPQVPTTTAYASTSSVPSSSTCSGSKRKAEENYFKVLGLVPPRRIVKSKSKAPVDALPPPVNYSPFLDKYLSIIQSKNVKEDFSLLPRCFTQDFVSQFNPQNPNHVAGVGNIIDGLTNKLNAALDELRQKTNSLKDNKDNLNKLEVSYRSAITRQVYYKFMCQRFLENQCIKYYHMGYRHGKKAKTPDFSKVDTDESSGSEDCGQEN